MDVKIKKLSRLLLAGRSMSMSLSADRTGELWSSFMPHLRHLNYRKGTNLFNVQLYDEEFNKKGIDPRRPYVKWAAAAIEQTTGLPEDLEVLVLPGGLYAVFLHEGPASRFPKTLQYIYGQWLPASDYELDHRPHFEILPENYRPDDPEAKEEVWIPIKPK